MRDSQPDRTPRVRVRAASWDNDEEKIRHVRETVFVQEQNIDESLEFDEWDASCQHLLAFADGPNALGTARLLPDGRIGRVAVLKPWRGRGMGTRLLKAALELAQERGFSRVFLHAQTQALAFYEGLGFHAQGDEFMEDGIAHVLMKKALNQPKSARSEH